MFAGPICPVSFCFMLGQTPPRLTSVVVCGLRSATELGDVSRVLSPVGQALLGSFRQFASLVTDGNHAVPTNKPVHTWTNNHPLQPGGQPDRIVVRRRTKAGKSAHPTAPKMWDAVFLQDVCGWRATLKRPAARISWSGSLALLF